MFVACIVTACIVTDKCSYGQIQLRPNIVTATYCYGLCAPSAHACVRARVITARMVMAYIVTGNIVATYIDTTKYSYGLYTPCACACAFVRMHTRMRVVMACIFMACIVTGCIGTAYAVAA